jgi:hypothetical protein
MRVGLPEPQVEPMDSHFYRAERQIEPLSDRGVLKVFYIA